MDYLAWLSLKSVPGIGNLLFRRLIDAFGSPETVFNATTSELARIEGISKKLATAILSHKTPDAVYRDLETVQQNKCRLIHMKEPDYPSLLLEIPDPPPILYVHGNLPEIPAVAIVGSRSATGYGTKHAERIAGELAGYGCSVVSGLARGIDTAAHSGALNVDGITVAVLGSGLGNIYPPENREIAYKISEKGAVISELPYMANPEPQNFPKRNRIISGISLGTLIVEAAAKSGSLITARMAAEQNREVFALPGNVGSAKSSGTHSLLKQGAMLVENGEDIVSALGYTLERAVLMPESDGAKPAPDEKKIEKIKLGLDFDEISVIDVLGLYPVHIDEILQKSSFDSGRLSEILLKFELMGIVKQSTGKMFSLNEDIT